MKLIEYLKQNNISQTRFSQISNIKTNSINRYIKGVRTPKIEIQEKIRQVTGGLVSYSDWIPTIASKTYYEDMLSKHKIPFNKILKILKVSDFEFFKLLKNDSFNKFQRSELDKFFEILEFGIWFKNKQLELKNKGFAQKQIADLLGLSVASISLKLENNGFSWEQISKIKSYALSLEGKKRLK